MKGLNKFISNNKKTLGSLLVIIGTTYTFVPAPVWQGIAALVINGAEQATEAE